MHVCARQIVIAQRNIVNLSVWTFLWQIHKGSMQERCHIVFTKLTHLIGQAKQAIIQTYKVSREVHQHPLERLLDFVRMLSMFSLLRIQSTATFTQRN